MKVITRFAPSPTGFLHVGGARSALFNYLFAKQNGGQIILRIEDTDIERNKEEYITGITDAFKWLGIGFDLTYKQSDNFPIHRKYIEKLISSGKAYISKEEIKKEGDRNEVIRFKNPNKDVTVDDIIKGQVKFNTTELGDFVIAKSLDEPIFHLSNVVDDITSGITHVIRGEEHLSNTPRQILIWEAINEVSLPRYAHIPLILSENREKISKRKHGEIVSVEYYKEQGYLRDALLNFLVLLGWNPGNDEEILSIDQMIEKFNIEKVQKAGAVFNREKLDWFNKQYMSKLSNEDFIDHCSKFVPKWLSNKPELFGRALHIIREKIHSFGDIAKIFEKGSEMNFIQDLGEYTADSLLWKKNPNKEIASNHLKEIKKLLDTIAKDNFTSEVVKSAIWPYAEGNGKGDVLWPFRFALTGQEKSPDPFSSAYILGKDESLVRIDLAISKLM
ncbi:MAG: glutamate--tRNA ligase family protein [Candidatus Paceibacterota bacterium]|jgi:glutamyl-tRNA synthetase